MKRFERHSRLDIAIHWSNAALWLLLTLTGLGLIKAEYNPLGSWYPAMLRGLFGGGGGLLLAHEIMSYNFV